MVHAPKGVACDSPWRPGCGARRRLRPARGASCVVESSLGASQDDIGNAACRKILTFEDTRRLERAVLRYPLIAKNRVDWDDFVRHGNARNFNYALEVAKTRLREHLGLPTVHQNLMIYRHEGSSSPADKNSAG